MEYDAIVIGARVAGSSLAILLGRQGRRVLLVDRDGFPSDTLSTHLLQPPAVEMLNRLGVLAEVESSGLRRLSRLRTYLGDVVVEGPLRAPGAYALCARRDRLDMALIRQAVRRHGVELLERTSAHGLVWEDGRVTGVELRTAGGVRRTVRARVVVGADGWHSVVTAAVQPERYHEKPPLLAAYYSYWSGLPTDGRFEVHIRPHRGFGAAPTHDGLTIVVGGWPQAEFNANKHDIEGNFLKALDLAPAFAERVRGAKREARFAGASLPNYFHKPYGSGWVLVGDAGYIKDSITAQGINDAFRDAEQCAAALDHWFVGTRSFDDVMGEYQRERDEHVMSMYEFTCQMATMEPPPPEMQQLFGAIARSREAMDGFVQMNAGTIAPSRFFAPENIGAIMCTAELASKSG